MCCSINFWVPCCDVHYDFRIFTICYQFLWIVHFLLPLRHSLMFICQFLWIVHFWLPLRYSLMFICQFLWIVHYWLALRYSLMFILECILSLPTSIINRYICTCNCLMSFVSSFIIWKFYVLCSICQNRFFFI